MLPGTQNFRKSGTRYLTIDTKTNVPPLGTYDPKDPGQIGWCSELKSLSKKHAPFGSLSKKLGNNFRRSMPNLREKEVEGKYGSLEGNAFKEDRRRMSEAKLLTESEASDFRAADSAHYRPCTVNMNKLTGREQFKKLKKYMRPGKAIDGEHVLLCYDAERKRKLRGI